MMTSDDWNFDPLEMEMDEYTNGKTFDDLGLANDLELPFWLEENADKENINLIGVPTKTPDIDGRISCTPFSNLTNMKFDSNLENILGTSDSIDTCNNTDLLDKAQNDEDFGISEIPNNDKVTEQLCLNANIDPSYIKKRLMKTKQENIELLQQLREAHIQKLEIRKKLDAIAAPNNGAVTVTNMEMLAPDLNDFSEITHQISTSQYLNFSEPPIISPAMSQTSVFGSPSKKASNKSKLPSSVAPYSSPKTGKLPIENNTTLTIPKGAQRTGHPFTPRSPVNNGMFSPQSHTSNSSPNRIINQNNLKETDHHAQGNFKQALGLGLRKIREEEHNIHEKDHPLEIEDKLNLNYVDISSRSKKDNDDVTGEAGLITPMKTSKERKGSSIPDGFFEPNPFNNLASSSILHADQNTERRPSIIQKSLYLDADDQIYGSELIFDDNEWNNDNDHDNVFHSENASPILKSRTSRNWEDYSDSYTISAEGCDFNSPSKKSKKPTTLPRGAIDQYVKELPDKEFRCLYPGCDKLFKRRYNIRSHIQTHLEDRPYACDISGCSKAFVRNHDLIRHKKSHFEKQYACPCGKKFNREDALVVHRSRMICSGGKVYENVVVKRSPRKRGRPKKESRTSTSADNSPVKSSLNNDFSGRVIFQMQEQLKNAANSITGKIGPL